jgi:hypothetical protein
MMPAGLMLMSSPPDVSAIFKANTTLTISRFTWPVGNHSPSRVPPVVLVAKCMGGSRNKPVKIATNKTQK